MKKSPEQELDLIIDSLNQEKDPKLEQDKEIDEQLGRETVEMLAVVRAVRTLRQPAGPSADFLRRLENSMGVRPQSRKTFIRLGVLAAGVILVLALAIGNGLYHSNVVLAMEKAVLELSGYHGTLEVVTQNSNGEKWMVRGAEIWMDKGKYALRQNDGTLTVNNGEQKWQVRKDDRELAILPLAPDYTKRGFDLEDEARKAKQYPHTIVGQEEIAGREAINLKISPPGGDPYHLWVDAETNLPLQLQTAVQNALQTTYTFVEFEPNVQIDPEIFRFQVPEGYQVVEEDPGQLVNNIQEASAVSGFTPVLPTKAPTRILAFTQRIVLDYGETTIVEGPAQEPLEPAGYGAWGQINGKPLEVIEDRLRWQQQGLEILIEGPQGLELARQLAPGLTLPDKSQELSSPAKVKVPVDMEIVQADQKQVDGGHTPWQLDPLSVALTFVNLQGSSGGIVGEPQIPYSAFKIEKNTGAEAMADVSEGPVGKVYLKRLVRQDESGIWTVVGYDPR